MGSSLVIECLYMVMCIWQVFVYFVSFPTFYLLPFLFVTSEIFLDRLYVWMVFHTVYGPDLHADTLVDAVHDWGGHHLHHHLHHWVPQHCHV